MKRNETCSFCLGQCSRLPRSSHTVSCAVKAADYQDAVRSTTYIWRTIKVISSSSAAYIIIVPNHGGGLEPWPLINSSTCCGVGPMQGEGPPCCASWGLVEGDFLFLLGTRGEDVPPAKAMHGTWRVFMSHRHSAPTPGPPTLMT